MGFIEQLTAEFEVHRNAKNALPMQAYMKHLFPFLGIKSPLRKTLIRTVVNQNKEEVKPNTTAIARALYQKQEREYHYAAMDSYARFKKRHYQPSDIAFIEHLLTTHTHWDTVDFIAKHILGQFLLEYPDLRNETIQRFSESDNMWLNRSAILFQLGYKSKTDFELLKTLCMAHKDSNEFFIRKAIGWALREYAKVNMPAVEHFVNNTDLKPLSKKEALKHLKKY
jgi:3-methyladenine DNA glycosylase AlkD